MILDLDFVRSISICLKIISVNLDRPKKLGKMISILPTHSSLQIKSSSIKSIGYKLNWFNLGLLCQKVAMLIQNLMGWGREGSHAVI